MALTDIKRQGYNLQRGASNGADITLIAAAGEYRALFDCATRCGKALGKEPEDLGDGFCEVIPSFRIPTENLYSALQKVIQSFSVALVEYCQTPTGARFVCLCKLDKVASRVPLPEQPQPVSRNLDDY